jgi:hypothetical protein
MKKFKAIKSLRPNTEFTMNDDDTSTIVWHTEGVTTPTETEIENEIIRLEIEELSIINEKEAARSSAIAKLQALGLTSEEAQAIIG